MSPNTGWSPLLLLWAAAPLHVVQPLRLAALSRIARVRTVPVASLADLGQLPGGWWRRGQGWRRRGCRWRSGGDGGGRLGREGLGGGGLGRCEAGAGRQGGHRRGRVGRGRARSVPAGAHDGRPDTLLGESQVLVGIEPAIIDGELAVRVLEHPGNREDPAGARRQCGTPMRALAGMRALGPCSHQQEPLSFWFCIGVMRGSANFLGGAASPLGRYM